MTGTFIRGRTAWLAKKVAELLHITFVDQPEQFLKVAIVATEVGKFGVWELC
jgi:hypothetical protein